MKIEQSKQSIDEGEIAIYRFNQKHEKSSNSGFTWKHIIRNKINLNQAKEW